MQAVIDAARASVTPILNDPATQRFLVIPPQPTKPTAEVLDLERFLDKPVAKRGTVTFHDPASFAAYWKTHANADSRIYVDNNVESPAIVAIFDHFGKDSAAWGRHRANYGFRRTPEWTAWLAHNDKKMAQQDFAEFLEDNIKDIVSPAGADMVQIAQRLIATRSGKFTSGINLNNGSVQFEVQHDIAAKVGFTSVEVPEFIVLGLCPYVGSARYEIKARFRYRIGDGGCAMFYKLTRVSDIVQDAIDGIVKDIAAGLGGDMSHFLYGVAPSPVG